MIRVLGIDPGLDGALAVLDLQQGGTILHLTKVVPTPTLDVMVNKEGVVSSYRTGHGYGLWRALVVAAQLPLTIVQPLVWRREFGLLRAGKQASVRAAVEGFPNYPWSLTRHDGAADAILIAAFVARRRVVPDALPVPPPPAPESPST
jgi:hypothetical protein